MALQGMFSSVSLALASRRGRPGLRPMPLLLPGPPALWLLGSHAMPQAAWGNFVEAALLGAARPVRATSAPRRPPAACRRPAGLMPHRRRAWGAGQHAGALVCRRATTCTAAAAPCSGRRLRLHLDTALGGPWCRFSRPPLPFAALVLLPVGSTGGLRGRPFVGTPDGWPCCLSQLLLSARPPVLDELLCRASRDRISDNADAWRAELAAAVSSSLAASLCNWWAIML